MKQKIRKIKIKYISEENKLNFSKGLEFLAEDFLKNYRQIKKDVKAEASEIKKIIEND